MATWPAKINYTTSGILTAAQMNDIGGELNDLYTTAGSAAGKNRIINGGFDIWQRGTSIAVTSSASGTYTADRWNAIRASSATGATVSRQVTGDTTNLPFIQYAARVQRDSGNTSTAIIYMQNASETINTIPFVGRTVTLSFYARAGANYSSASSALSVVLGTGTGTDQNPNSYTGYAAAISQTATLTTTWQRFSYSTPLATTVNEFSTNFSYTPVGTAGANDYFEITGVQLELGSSATPFSRVGGTIQGELQACERYYYRVSSDSGYKTLGLGYASDAATLQIAVPLPSRMRVIPTSIDIAALANYYYEGTGAGSTPTSITLSGRSTVDVGQITFTKAASFTQGGGYSIMSNNTSAFIGFSSEL